MGAGRKLSAGLAICAVLLSGGAGFAWAQARPGAPDKDATVSELVVTAYKTVSELLLTAPIKCIRSPTPRMLLSSDRRTIRTICYVRAKSHYGAVINPQTPYGPFKNLAGVPAQDYDFDFTTSAAPRVRTACEALMQDAVTAHEIVDRGKHYCGPPEGD